MNRARLLFFALLVASLFAAFTAHANQPFVADQAYGDVMPAEPEAVSLAEAIASLGENSQATVKIMGKVTEVCQTKGCWMILVDGETYARVTFKDYGFFVPIETSMQRTVVYGVLSEHVLSAEEAAEFAKDAGSKSTLELEGEVKEYSLVASAVELERKAS